MCVCQTLRADQHQRQVGGVPVVGEAAVVVIDGLKADLVLQAEDEDDGVDPESELQPEEERRKEEEEEEKTSELLIRVFCLDFLTVELHLVSKRS